MTARDTFLERVRQAVAEGNRLSPTPPLDERGGIGYQGAGPDLVQRFAAELTAAGGVPIIAADAAAALAAIRTILETKQARRLLLGGGIVERLGLAAQLADAGYQVVTPADVNQQASREPFFAADAGISGVEHLIAETGSLVMATTPGEPRSVSLLPPVHIAVAVRSQIMPDLFDLFSVEKTPSSCLTLITGPSKTGDIELKLVTGVHGPGEVHVILIEADTV